MNRNLEIAEKMKNFFAAINKIPRVGIISELGNSNDKGSAVNNAKSRVSEA